MASEHWQDKPQVEDFPAAESYLSLLVGAEAASKLAKSLRKQRSLKNYAARDMLRAAHLPILARSGATLDYDHSSGMPHVRGAVSRVLTSHEPYPVLVKDRYWNVIDRNRSMETLTQGVDPKLLEPPVNALRMALHPNGLAPRIINLAEWSSYLLRRLDHQVLVTGEALAEEIRSSAGVTEHSGLDSGGEERVVVPRR